MKIILRLEQKYSHYFPLEVISTNYFFTERSRAILSRRQAKLDSNYQYHYQPALGPVWCQTDESKSAFNTQKVYLKKKNICLVKKKN